MVKFITKTVCMALMMALCVWGLHAQELLKEGASTPLVEQLGGLVFSSLNQDVTLGKEEVLPEQTAKADYALRYYATGASIVGLGANVGVGTFYSHGCISFTSAQMYNYAGGTLDQISFYFPTASVNAGLNTNSGTVWIKNALDGAVVYSQPCTITPDAWNDVVLTTPYPLTTSSLVIGFSVSHTTTSGTENEIRPITLTTTGDSYKEGGVNYILGATVPNTHGAGAVWNIYNAAGNMVIAGYVTGAPALPTNDLAVSAVTAPALKWVDNPTTFVVTVYNTGTASQNNYTVQLIDASNNVLASQAVTTALASGTSIDVNVNYTPTAAGNVNISGRVIVAGDEVAGNDVSAPLFCKIYQMQPMAYCSSISDNALGNNSAAATWDGAIQYPPSAMLPYSGKKLTAIELYIAVEPSLVSNCSVWVRNSLVGTKLVSQTFTPVQGWNVVSLSTPYILTNENTYIGFTYTAQSGNPMGLSSGNMNAAYGGHFTDPTGLPSTWITLYPVVAGVDANLALIGVVEKSDNAVITVSKSPAAGGTVGGGGTYTTGNPVTVTATPNTGYTFVNWTENGTEVSTSTSYSFTAADNRTLVANFQGGSGVACDDYPIGTGTIAVTFLPCNTYFDYSYSQQIFDADELGATPGNITSISFNYTYAIPVTRTDQTIFLGNTTQSTFNAVNQWIPVNQLQQVFTGTIEYSNDNDGWTTITIDPPFAYTGGNLVVAYLSNQGTNNLIAARFLTHTVPNKEIHYFYDKPNPQINPANPNAYSGGVTTYSLTYRSNVIFEICTNTPPPDCAAPTNLTASYNSDCTANLSWNAPNGNGNDAIYNVYRDGQLIASKHTTTSYTDTDNNPSTGNNWYVVQLCDDDVESDPSNTATLNVCGIGTGCNDKYTDQSGSISVAFPVHHWAYSYTQQLYKDADIDFPAGAMIQSIAFKCFVTSMSRGNQTIYLANTTLTEMSTSWIPINQFTPVYQGEIAFTASEWTVIELDEPFEYTGGNLVIAYLNSSGVESSLFLNFYVHYPDYNSVLYYYNQTTPANPSSPPAAAAPLTRLSDVKFYVCTDDVTEPDCAAPTNLTASYNSDCTANLSWAPAGKGKASFMPEPAIFEGSKTAALETCSSVVKSTREDVPEQKTQRRTPKQEMTTSPAEFQPAVPFNRGATSPLLYSVAYTGLYTTTLGTPGGYHTQIAPLPSYLSYQSMERVGETVYVITYNENTGANTFGTLNPTTGVLTTITNNSSCDGISMAWNPVDNQVYVTQWGTSTSTPFGRVNLTNGSFINTGNISQGYTYIAIDNNGVCYAVTPTNFGTINLSNGQFTSISSYASGGFIQDLYVDRETNELYHINISGQLVNINKSTGATTLLGTFSNFVESWIIFSDAGEPCPAAASNVTATEAGTDVVVNWSAAAGAVSYDILRDNSVIGNVTTTTYTDVNAPAGPHTYGVKALYAGDCIPQTVNAPPVTVGDMCYVKLVLSGPYSDSWSACTPVGYIEVLVDGVSFGSYTGNNTYVMLIPSGLLELKKVGGGCLSEITLTVYDVENDIILNMLQGSFVGMSAGTVFFTYHYSCDPPKYNVYRDGVLIAENIKWTTYTDSGLNPFDGHTWWVTQVCEGGEESLPAEVSKDACTLPIACAAPNGLVVEHADEYTEECNAELTWTHPNSKWIKHCTKDLVIGGIGYSGTEGADMTVAIRFTPTELALLGVKSGDPLSKVALGIYSHMAQVNTMEIRIWEGGTSVTNPGTLVYTQPITNYTSFTERQMVEIPLTTPWIIDATKELRIGWNLVNTGGYPFGRDEGPNVPGKGLLLHCPFLNDGAWVDGAVTYNWHYNWTMKAFVDGGEGKTTLYNIYMDDEPIETNWNTTAYTHTDFDYTVGHTWSVSQVCDDDESDQIYATKKACNNGCKDKYTAQSSSTSIAFPAHYWAYSYTQQLYKGADIDFAAGAMIQSIAFKSASPTITRGNQTIYLANTTLTEMTSNWLPINQFTPVYQGEITFMPLEWTVIELNAPFEYTGGNLVIAYLNSSGVGTDYNTLDFYVRYDVGYNSVLYYYNQTTPANPSSPPTANGLLNRLSDVYFYVCEPNNCAAPTNLTASYNPDCTVNLSWDAPDGSDNNAIYNIYRDGQLIASNHTSTSYTDTGNTPATGNNWYVVQVCDGDVESDPSNTATLNVCGIGTECNDKYTDQSGDLSMGFLVHYFPYSYTQQLYKGADIDFPAGAMIQSIAFKSSTAMTKGNQTIYLANTTLTEMTSNWIPINQFTPVYQGEITFTPLEWTVIELNEPFEYTGGNLVIAYLNSSGTLQGSTSFYSHYPENNSNSVLYYYNQTIPANPSSPPTANGLFYRLTDVKFHVCEPSNCAAPTNLTASYNSDCTVNLSWDAPDGSDNDAIYNVYRDGQLIVSNHTSTSYTDTDNTPATGNNWYVVQVCDGDVESDQSNTATLDVCGIGTECNDKYTDQSGTTSVAFPVHPWQYSYTQQLYKDADIDFPAGAMIQSIAFQCAASITKGNQTVYLANTTLTEMGSSWIPINQFTPVYQGEITFTASEWTVIELNEPFEYTGDNLVIAYLNSSGVLHAAANFYVHYPDYNSVLYYYNQTTPANPSSPPTASGPLARLSDVKFYVCTGNVTEPDDCDPPTNLTASYNSDCTVNLSWDAPDGSDNDAVYNVYRDGQLIASNHTSTSYTDTGNTPAAGNNWYVVQVCEGDVESDPSNTETLDVCGIGTECNDKYTDQSGTTSVAFPVHPWQYSYTQQLYKDADIDFPAGAMIQSIAFQCAASITKGNQTVYLANTTLTEMGSSWIPINQFTPVYQGEITFTASEWTVIELNEPFEYTGDNLVIAYLNSSGVLHAAANFYVHYPDYNSVLYYYNQTTPANPSSPPTASGPLARLSDVKFYVCEPSNCAAPTNLTASYNSDCTVNLSWDAPDGSDNDATYNVYRDGQLIASNHTTTSYTDTGNTVTDHTWSVTHVCGNDESKPVEFSLEPIAVPVATAATNQLCGSFVANWNTSDADCYLLSVYTIGADQTITYLIEDEAVCDENSYLVEDLAYETTYYYSVKSTLACHTSTASNVIEVAPLSGNTITVTTCDDGTITPAGPVTLNCGDSQTFNFEIDTEGYEIYELLIDGVAQNSYIAGGAYTFNNVTGDHSIEIKCRIITYNIIATAGPNGIIDPAGINAVEYDDNLEVCFEANEGFVIYQVLVDGINQPDYFELEEGCYLFENVKGNHTITVMFKSASVPQAYTITATTDAGGKITPAGTITVNPGASQKFTFSALAGYEITDVLIDGGSDATAVADGFYTFFDVDADHSIHVVIDQLVSDDCVVHVSFGKGGTISPNGTVNVPKGTYQTFTITPQQGYKIDQVWIDNDNTSLDALDAIANGYHVFYGDAGEPFCEHWISATFTYISVEQFYITASVSTTGGTISPTGKVLVSTGDEPVFTFTPQTGFELTDVLIDGIALSSSDLDAVKTSGVYTFAPVFEAHTIVGKFGKQNFVITSYIGTAGGTINPVGDKTVTYGGSQAYTITAQASYMIDEVKIDGTNNPTAVSSGKYTFSNVIKDHDIVANFKYKTYDITSSVSGTGGIINPEGTFPIIHGDIATYSIIPDDGYIIKSVLVDGKNNAAAVSSGTYTFNNVTAKHTIVATFAIAKDAEAEYNESAEIALYPNPTTGELRITYYRHCGLDPQSPENDEIAGQARNDIHSVDVFDMLGRKVMTVTESQIAHRTSQTTFDLSNVPTGVYFVRIQTENDVVIRKVVKE